MAYRCVTVSQPLAFPPLFSTAGLAGWGAFIYVSVISMFAAFMFWYRGLALGGTAAVGQLQFLQPFLTIIAATFVFGETLQSSVVVFALGVALLIFLGRYLPAR
jgi:drug/metabolite transporter (DMT)-like permease